MDEVLLEIIYSDFSKGKLEVYYSDIFKAFFIKTDKIGSGWQKNLESKLSLYEFPVFFCEEVSSKRDDLKLVFSINN